MSNSGARTADKANVASASKPSWLGLKELLLIGGGIVAFLIVNVSLFLARCSTNEFMVSCDVGHGRDWLFVASIVAFLGFAAFVNRLARMFAMGFAGAFAALTVVSAGACTTPWADPYVVAKRRFDEQPWRAAQLRRAANNRTWVDTMSNRAMDLARGVEMASSIAACTQTPIEGCASGFVVDKSRDDAGWRWSYKRVSGGLTVEVKPDDALPHRWPRVTASSDGVVSVMLTSGAVPFVVSPVDDLKQLAMCLRRIPQVAPLMPDGKRIMPQGWSLTYMSIHLCGVLSPKLTAPEPSRLNDERATLLAVMMPPGTAAESAVPLATYRVEFVPHQPATDSFAFDLTATPMIRGLPRYLVTLEGVVHRTMQPRDATVGDTVVAR